MENLITVLYVERQIKKKGVFESPTLLSVTFKDAKKIDLQNPVIGNLLSQVNANKITDAKQLLGQAKDDEIQARLNKLRKRIDKSDNNKNNTNFDDSDVDDDDDDDNNDGGDELRRRYNNLRRLTTIPNNNDEEADTTISKHHLTAKKNYFVDTMTLEHLCFKTYHSPPLPLRRPNIEKEYDDTFLRPPQSSTVAALKTDFDRPITNLIDKANNVIEMIPENEK